MNLIIYFILLAYFGRNFGQEQCLEKNARYATGQCDGYIECLDGYGQFKLCPDGLFFNPQASMTTYPCQYPIEVNCDGRSALQPPQSNGLCPHQFGYYRTGSASECQQYLNCANGEGYVFTCPEGLAFDERSYKCDWPDMVPSCDAESYLGFSCPQNVPDASYSSPYSCQHYYACVKSRPRLFTCPDGKGFDPQLSACGYLANITSCDYRSAIDVRTSFQ